MSKVIFPVAFPLLETERLVLRELSQDDSETLFQNCPIPDSGEKAGLGGM